MCRRLVQNGPQKSGIELLKIVPKIRSIDTNMIFLVSFGTNVLAFYILILILPVTRFKFEKVKSFFKIFDNISQYLVS